MRIQVRVRVGDDAALLDDIERRLRFALGRFDPHVARVDARITDANGPRGGIDQVCRLYVTLSSPHRRIVIEDVDVAPRVALARAAERAARTVARAVAHTRHGRQVRARSQEAWS